MSTTKSFARSIVSSGRFVRQQVWVWPIIAGIILGSVGWVLRGGVESAVKHTMAEDLSTILAANVAALEFWLSTQKDNATAIASAVEVERLVGELAAAAADPEVDQLQLAGMPAQIALRNDIDPWLEAHDYLGFAVVNKNSRIVASEHTEMIGRDDLPLPEGLIEKVFAGETVVTPPFKSAVKLPDEQDVMRPELPTMFAVAPVRNANDEVIALLGLRINPKDQFTEILRIGRPGKSGETFAFDRRGVMVSNSRFDDDLRRIRLLPEDKSSILNVQLRDPQVNMMEGRQPKLLTSQQPLTVMAASALEGNDDRNVEGYRDYRGVPVIGSWMWLDEYGFGVASEMNVDEAYRPLYLLRWAFWSLFALLAASSVAIFVYSLVVARMQTDARKAALKAKELGQYELEEKLGAGAMGVVYRGRHAMLQRPTAVKLLDPEKMTESAAARFEREVQSTAKLNHPNTIAIYDYGRTPEGIFYYAMELLDGIDLQELIAQHGPLPEGRVVRLLMQICASLNEAHMMGLIHRDIKPGNIVLNVRGGIYDFVKVLDFGLVKAVDGRKQQTLTAAGSFTGTPLYLSPEGIESPESVNARSDLYAVGAAGFFLVTGHPLFDVESVVEVVMKQLNAMPALPSERLGRKVDDQLEAIIMQCLAKDPKQRPASAKELERMLAACPCIDDWTESDAQAWWQENSEQGSVSPSSSSPAQETKHVAATLVVDPSPE